jgi:hypothetical protein
MSKAKKECGAMWIAVTTPLPVAVLGMYHLTRKKKSKR